MAYLRLRQICLVAYDLKARANELRQVFELGEGHPDAGIARLGLENIVIPAGRQPVFLEIVAPIREGTTAERYLERRGGDGGYMYIVDDSEHEAAKARVQALGVRIITERVSDDEPRARLMQLHPKDTGGAMIEIDWHGAGEDMLGPYRWAGDDWQAHLRTGCVQAVLGAEIQSDDPASLARRWSEILGRPVETGPDGDPQLVLDNAFARFTPPKDARGEGLSAVHVAVSDPEAVRRRARDLGLPFADEAPIVCGVRFPLTLA